MGDYNNMIRCLWKGVADTDQQIDAADRIEELEAKLRSCALQELSALGQASEAYQAQLAAEAKLAKAVGALKHIEHYDIHAPTHARNILKELTGGEDE